MNPDRLAELEEQRRFLLSSIRDIEREHDVGDVDDHDFHALRDGYVARAAAVMREIEDGRSSLPPKPTSQWWRRPALIVGTLAVEHQQVGAVRGSFGVAGFQLEHALEGRASSGCAGCVGVHQPPAL